MATRVSEIVRQASLQKPAARLRELIAASGKSNYEVAGGIFGYNDKGKPRRTGSFYGFLNGTTAASAANRQRLADYFGVSPDDFRPCPLSGPHAQAPAKVSNGHAKPVLLKAPRVTLLPPSPMAPAVQFTMTSDGHARLTFDMNMPVAKALHLLHLLTQDAGATEINLQQVQKHV